MEAEITNNNPAAVDKAAANPPAASNAVLLLIDRIYSLFCLNSVLKPLFIFWSYIYEKF